jgi:hypothetical protein
MNATSVVRSKREGDMSTIHWTALAEVASRPVHWLWEGRLPFGKVTLLDGEPGSGKSLLALDLGARVSRGAAMPLSRVKPPGPANVVIYNDDDNLDDTVRPRLEACGADLSRIRAFDGEVCPEDLLDARPALIVIDPLSTYLCLSRDCPPRQVLKRLAAVARETGAAVLAVQYLPKDGDWSGEAYDAARTVLSVTTIGHGRHRLSVTKSNLRSLGDVPPLVFHFESAEASVRVAGWADSV